jgi:proline dehydrogenase
MLMRNVFLYLSRRPSLKGVLTTFPGAKQVTARFIAGENIDDALAAIRVLNRQGVTATFDHLGESTTLEAQAVADTQAYMHALRRIDESGIESNVSVKPTQLGLDIDEELCYRNLRDIVAEAARLKNFVRIDMEDSTKTDATLRLLRRLRADYDNVGVVLQAYLYRTEKDLEEVLGMGSRVRLCKGAYDEPAEVAFPEKAEVDANYIKLMKRLLTSGIYHGIATQDEKMIVATKEFAARENISRDAFEFQMLYGVRRDLPVQLAQEGYRVRTYVPYGEHWYPYFMRRLAERPANVWFVLKNLFKG